MTFWPGGGGDLDPMCEPRRGAFPGGKMRHLEESEKKTVNSLINIFSMYPCREWQLILLLGYLMYLYDCIQFHACIITHVLYVYIYIYIYIHI